MARPLLRDTNMKIAARKKSRVNPADEAAAKNDQVKFEGREREYVYAVAMKYLKDEEEAADVAQDALLNAFRHRASFRGDSRFTTWLYRVAATTALMHLRKKRRSRLTLLGAPVERDGEATTDPMADMVAPGPSPEDAAAAHEALALAERRLDTLGDKYGSIFRMRFADGFSESEIADELQLNVATVKTRAYRARAALRDELTTADAA
jgi:RNA polymerase sigma-70 factor (ECF subfamily)